MPLSADVHPWQHKWNGCSSPWRFLVSWARLPSRQMREGRCIVATKYVTLATILHCDHIKTGVAITGDVYFHFWLLYRPFLLVWQIQGILRYSRLLFESLYRALGLCEWNVSLFWKPTLSPSDIQAPSSPSPSLIIRSKQIQANGKKRNWNWGSFWDSFHMEQTCFVFAVS